MNIGATILGVCWFFICASVGFYWGKVAFDMIKQKEYKMLFFYLLATAIGIGFILMIFDI